MFLQAILMRQRNLYIIILKWTRPGQSFECSPMPTETNLMFSSLALEWKKSLMTSCCSISFYSPFFFAGCNGWNFLLFQFGDTNSQLLNIKILKKAERGELQFHIFKHEARDFFCVSCICLFVHAGAIILCSLRKLNDSICNAASFYLERHLVCCAFISTDR